MSNEILQKSSSNRWLVTGAAGFIGSSLVESLLRRGQYVVAMDDFSGSGHSGRAFIDRIVAEYGTRLTFVEGDVRERGLCLLASSGIDFILHNAAIGAVNAEGHDTLQHNVDGTISVCDAGRRARVKRLILASSCSVYGDGAVPAMESQVLSPRSAYAMSKRLSEKELETASEAGLECVTLRYFNVYGRRQRSEGRYAAVIPRWITQCLSGHTLLVHGDGGQTRDFCHVSDVVEANLRAATVQLPHRSYGCFNVGSGTETSLLRLASMVMRTVERHTGLKGNLDLKLDADKHFGIGRSVADVSHSATSLGFKCKIRLKTGLDDTVKNFLKMQFIF